MIICEYHSFAGIYGTLITISFQVRKDIDQPLQFYPGTCIRLNKRIQFNDLQVWHNIELQLQPVCSLTCMFEKGIKTNHAYSNSSWQSDRQADIGVCFDWIRYHNASRYCLYDFEQVLGKFCFGFFFCSINTCT